MVSMSDTLVINEIFFSIQGESTRAGEPCIFVRLAGCDLRCSWCDTEYAFHEGERMTVEKIMEEVQGHPCNLVEVTGGEPLLQKGVHHLIQSLLEEDYEVMLETGGHRDISEVDPRVKIICDVKCPDSGMSEANRRDNLELLRDNDELKFVIASRKDYEWARAKVEEEGLGRKAVLFSPVWEGVSPRDLAEWILADGLSVRMQLQLHKILWGAETRGV